MNGPRAQGLASAQTAAAGMVRTVDYDAGIMQADLGLVSEPCQ
jgi:hypothetical protein